MMSEIFDGFSFSLLTKLLGGLAVFLIGLDLMSVNLRKIAGSTLRLILERATDNPFLGVAVGTIVTAIIQSSSATTSILISLVQSQLINFERSIAVVMGANIGTTITAQIIAFKITKWSLAIIFVGFLFYIFAKRTKTQNFGLVIQGLGFLFFGLEIMSTSMKVLRGSDYFLDLMSSLSTPWLGILVGAIFTALVQSSSASIGIMIGLVSQGLIGIESGMPLILGANIGTCITAVLASIKSGPSAKRVAAVHVMFNIGGVLLFIFWIPEFINFVKSFTPAGDEVRLVANAQTSFNIIATLVWLPLMGVLDYAAKKIIVEDKHNKEREKYFLPRISGLKDAPELIIAQSADAIKSHKNLVKEMLWLSRDYLVNKEESKLHKISELRTYQQEFKSDILDFLNRAGKLRLTYNNVARILMHTTLINEIDQVASKLEASLAELNNAKPKLDENYQGFEEYFKKTVQNFSKSCNAVLNESILSGNSVLFHLRENDGIEETLRKQSIDNLHHKLDMSDYQNEKLNLWLLEFLRSVNETSKRICGIMVDKEELFAMAEPEILEAEVVQAV